MRKKWWLVIIIGLVIVGGVYFYRQKTAVKPVVTVKPQVRDLVASLAESGNIDAHEKANLRFLAASRLTWIGVKEGDQVKKWQSIASVDSAQLGKQLQIDQNLHGIEFRSFEQTLQDNNYYGAQGLTDKQRRTVEDAQLGIQNTALTVEMQDIAIKLASIYSPIDGIVTKIDQPNVGVTTMPTDTIQIINPQTVYFSVIVDEADIGKINIGQKSQVVLDAYPNELIQAIVAKVAFTPSTSQSGGLGYEVTLSLPIENGIEKYRLGMSGDAKIILKEVNQVLSIPTDAIIERNSKLYVDLMKNGKPVRTEIQTGIADENYTEIVSGVTPADQVVMPSAGGK